MDYLILFFVGYIAALTPGPDIFYVIRQGLCNGLKNAFLAVAGILTGNVIYLTLVYLGLGSIGKNPYFQLIVGFLGAIYLFRIALIIFKENVKIDKKCELTKNVYKEALFLNLSNPKAMIFFAIIVTPFLSKNIMLSFFSLFSGIALAFVTGAFLGAKIDLDEKIMSIVNKIASFIFMGFGIKLLEIAYEAFEKIKI
jgi:threonine/homoserine/homoserine lactone efflux protein